MTDINNEFDNLTGLSDVKNFDQSQVEELNKLNVPQAYQEFNEIEHELNRGQHSLSEITTFAEQFTEAKVVKRDDVLALESLIGDLSTLPHLNSYTEEYSLVNYQVTQESVYATVVKYAKKAMKAIYDFIMKTIEYISENMFRILGIANYTNDTSSQDVVTGHLTELSQLIEDSTGKITDSLSKLNEEQIAIREVRINKELRALLYPRFNELGVLSRGGNINVGLLIDEMCEQRFKPFYNTLFKAVHERDKDLKDLISLYTRTVQSKLLTLAINTTKVWESDHTKEPDFTYSRSYAEAAEEQINFLANFNTGSVRAAQVNDSQDEFKVLASAVFETVTEMTDIRNTHDLPSPRVLLDMDMYYLTALFDSGVHSTNREVENSFKDVKRAYRVKQSDRENIHPLANDNINNIYADWISVNRMVLTTVLLTKRINALWSNISNMTDISIKAIDIITQ